MCFALVGEKCRVKLTFVSQVKKQLTIMDGYSTSDLPLPPKE